MRKNKMLEECMNIIKYFFKNAWKNKGMFFLYIFIYTIILLLNTSGDIAKEPSVFKEVKANIGIISLSQDSIALELETYLKEYVGEDSTLTYLPDSIPKAKEQIFMGNYDAIIRIPPDFSQKFRENKASIQILFNTLDYSGYLVQNRVEGFLSFVKATEQNGIYNIPLSKKALSEKSEVILLEYPITAKNEKAKIWMQSFFNMASYIVIAIYIAVIGKSTTDFYTLNIKQRIAISSKELKSIQLELYLGQLIIGSMITGFIMLIVFLFLRKQIFQLEFGKYILNISIFSLSIMALTFMINNLTNNDSSKNALSTILSLGSAFISGVIIPQNVLSPKVLTVAKFFPVYYYIALNQKSHPDIYFLVQNLGIQILFGILFLILGMYFAQKRRIME